MNPAWVGSGWQEGGAGPGLEWVLGLSLDNDKILSAKEHVLGIQLPLLAPKLSVKLFIHFPSSVLIEHLLYARPSEYSR